MKFQRTSVLTPPDRESDTPAVRRRSAQFFHRAFDDLSAQVDRMFVWLLAAEWLGMIASALIVAPRTWSGTASSLHPHLLAAILSGPAFIFPAIVLALIYPSRQITRHVIAVAQILVSSLLIDVTGGRIETHFHIFGSLAFLAFYRDWRVLVTASALTALDHLAGGIWWPQAVYGVLTASPWRWVEHAWWVVFEDFFLILASRRSDSLEMWAVAMSKAQLSCGRPPRRAHGSRKSAASAGQLRRLAAFGAEYARERSCSSIWIVSSRRTIRSVTPPATGC